jgi:hypothetical protein
MSTEMDDLIARIPEGYNLGPCQFEPQPHFGTKLGGEDWPFGYLSTAHPQPIFELRPILGFPKDDLTAAATMFALAPEMAAAIRKLTADLSAARQALAVAREVLAELADDLEVHLPVRDPAYPSEARRKERDMAPVRRARDFLARSAPDQSEEG